MVIFCQLSYPGTGPEKGENSREIPLFFRLQGRFRALNPLPFPHPNDVPLPPLKRRQKPT